MGSEHAYGRHAMGRIRFDGIDALNDESRRSGIEFTQLEPGALQAEYQLASTGRVHFSVATYSMWLLANGSPPPGCAIVALPPLGDHPVSPEGFVLGEGCLYFEPGREFVRALPSGAPIVAVVVDHAAFEEVAEAELGIPLSRIARMGVFETRGEASRSRLVADVLQLAGRALEHDPAHGSARGHLSEIESDLFRALLEASLPSGLARKRPDRLRVARRAAVLLHEKAAAPDAIADVARELKTTLRTLESGFRETFGISPRLYRQCVRLQRARDDLRRAREGETVGTVAMRHGLLHLGRFSVSYRRMFGESPMATLRRERGGRRTTT